MSQFRVYIPGEVIIKGPKTESSTRKISLTPDHIELLKRHRIAEVEKKLKAGTKWKNPDGHILTGSAGIALHPNRFNNFLKRFAEKHKTATITPHALRHHAASYFILIGKADLRTISARFGHNKVSSTLNIYSHVIQSAE